MKHVSSLGLTLAGIAGDQVVLVSSAEFVLKSSHVRRTLEQRLIDDLRYVLRKADFRNFTIDKAAGRIIVSGIDDAVLAARAVERVFGVAYAIPANRVDGSLEVILNTVRQRAVDTLTTEQSFAIRCHRSSQCVVSTRDVEREGGSQILNTLADRKIRVNLNHPNVLISVDLSGQTAYVYTTRLPGPGGLPISSQWKMLGILDAGPLSLFAAYVMMRRGCLIQLLIPCSTTNMRFQSERQLALARELKEFVPRENYPGFILELDQMPQATKGIRRVGLEFARKHRFRGIVLADIAGSIGFDNALTRRSKELGIPVFQPLIGLDETDLTKLGQLFDVEWRQFGDFSVESASADSLDLAYQSITQISL